MRIGKTKEELDLSSAVQSSQQWLFFSSGSGNFLHWKWELLLAVGMPCAFYSQHASLDQRAAKKQRIDEEEEELK
nr:hypothetical protein [Tanacetum cinerariifolium]